jgi:c-di-GMP-binding flagellar brake protein YcgR
MRVWTNTTFRALDLLSGPIAADEREVPKVTEVLSTVLTSALANREGPPPTLLLSRCDPGTRPLPIEAPIEAIDDHAITIGRPLLKPGQRSLAAGERLKLRFTLDGVTYSGTTMVIARFESAPQRVAYRLAMPSSLLCDDRRRSERVAIAFEQAPVAELLNAPTHRPIAEGVLIDLAMGGARVRARLPVPTNTTPHAAATSAAALIPGMPRAGDRVLIRARLSDTMRLHALGTVVHAGRRGDGEVDIGVRFTSDVPDLDRCLRQLAAHGVAGDER